MSEVLVFFMHPIAYLPLAVLLLLVGIIWTKNADDRLKTILGWFTAYLLVVAVLIGVAYTQYQSGCGFGLGDCYNDKLPDGFWALKLVVVLAYYAWFAAAILSTLRRLMGVSDRASKKGALLLVGALSAALTAFLVYLSTFGS